MAPIILRFVLTHTKHKMEKLAIIQWVTFQLNKKPRFFPKTN